MGLSACGGDNGSGADSGATTVSASGTEGLRATLDAACIDNAVAVNDAAERYGIPEGFQGSAAYEAARSEAAAEQAAAVAGLEPPDELTADYGEFVAVLEEYADNYAQIAESSAQGDEGAYDAATQRGQEIGGRQIALAEPLGLQACARHLPPEQEGAVREITERVLLGSDPERSCAEDLTDNFQRVNAGRGRACERRLGALAADGAQLEYLFTTGIEGTVASANVDFATSADREPRYLIYDLLWDEGTTTWKIDSSFDPGTPAPDAPPGSDTGSSDSA